MRLLIVRHGDPDYELDSLTEKGEREVKLLAKRLEKMKIDRYFCSPLGRAQKTASYTLEAKHATAKTLDWLQEFPGHIQVDGKTEICWDRLPSLWTERPIYFSKEWYQGPLFAGSSVKEEFDKVCNGLDALLEELGYRHVGNHFQVLSPNDDVNVLFCHFGVESVILSHLFGISPMFFWHNTCALTSSVTTLITEEREKGTAIFRMLGFSDTSHLYAGNEPLSFQARFCEMYSNEDERH